MISIILFRLAKRQPSLSLNLISTSLMQQVMTYNKLSRKHTPKPLFIILEVMLSQWGWGGVVKVQSNAKGYLIRPGAMMCGMFILVSSWVCKCWVTLATCSFSSLWMRWCLGHLSGSSSLFLPAVKQTRNKHLQIAFNGKRIKLTVKELTQNHNKQVRLWRNILQ